MTMDTASTLACLAEAMRIAPPGNVATPAADSRRLQLAEATGRYAVALADRDVPPSAILTPAAFDNAIRVLHAIGGSANAVIHLIALAGRLGIELPLGRFDELSRTTPLLLDLKPAGRFLMEDFFRVGGVPALVAELGPLLDLSAPTVTGRTLGENCAGARAWDRDVIRPLAEPIAAEGGLAVVRGSLAPAGAIIKVAAASPGLLTHRGRAVVFDEHDDLLRRVDDPGLDVRPDDVLVLRGADPVGGPGMPQWGFLPIPRKLLAAGVRDMVRVSDARMSGAASGTVAPEAAAGVPLAAVRDGDPIVLDVPNRRLDLLVDPGEVARRLAAAPRPSPPGQRLRVAARPARPPGRRRVRLRLPAASGAVARPDPSRRVRTGGGTPGRQRFWNSTSIGVPVLRRAGRPRASRTSAAGSMPRTW